VKRGHVAIVLSVLLLVGGWIAATADRGGAPVSVEGAHLSGDVWVMPEKQVVAFLHERGVAYPNANPYPSGTAVVGRVSWTAHEGAAGDRFTILLGDDHGGTGVIRQVLGPPEKDVALGSGSMWDATTASRSWLRQDGTLKLDTGNTSFGQFASVPTTWGGDVWYVAYVVDARGKDLTGGPPRVDHPTPAVGVALSTDDHVWWLQRLGSA
jgi:hypothetical protein